MLPDLEYQKIWEVEVDNNSYRPVAMNFQGEKKMDFARVIQQIASLK